MKLLNELRLRFRLPTLDDPDFGMLIYMHVPRNPARSYWEGQWLFPPTGTRVSISLSGSLAGPSASARAFYLAIPSRFDRIIERVRPALDRVLREWLEKPLRADLWQDVTLGGFDLEDPDAVPVAWGVGFETTGEKWLGITSPFVDDEPREPVVDT